ncbi:hypothetical protein CBW21_05870 [Chromobacterium violaceum]|uniref:Uncharacterized protein n=1 Tax=Chromobacterium violaceum TaxID=536 RepID=A0A202BD66_CHRVL|nr:hypothetical protein CBW21_05870 [Chromobacterium violaceum]
MGLRRPRIIEHHAIPIRTPQRSKYFHTWEEAHVALLERARKQVVMCERKLAESRRFLEKVETMRKGDK